MKRGMTRRFAAGALLAAALTIGTGAATVLAAAPAATTITSVKAAESTVTITWKAVKKAYWYKIYAKQGNGEIKLLKTRSAARETTYKATNLRNSEKYTFYVEVWNEKKETSALSAGVSATPKVTKPGKVTDLTVSKVGKTSATLTWSATKNATGYAIWQKLSSGKLKKLTTTHDTSITLKNLTEGKSYQIVVRAYRTCNGGIARADRSSPVWILPSSVASAVSQIHPYNTSTYATNSSIVYSAEVAEAFVNSGYVRGMKIKSPTGWLIWVNTYSQHMYIFKGSNGSWKLQKCYICSTGMHGRTPLGRTKIKRKSPKWTFSSIQFAYWASSISSGAIHSELYYPNGAKWNLGALGTAASHGCIRLPIDGAKYVYDIVPIGTYVWVW